MELFAKEVSGIGSQTMKNWTAPLNKYTDRLRVSMTAGIFLSAVFSLTVAQSQSVQDAQHSDSAAWQEHFAVAQAAQQNQDYARAEQEYRAVLALKPDFAEVHMNLGLIFQLQGHTQEAMSEFRTALKLKPTLAGANFFLGVNYCQLGNGKQAIPHLRAAALAEPTGVDILSWLATAQEMVRDFSAEIVTLQKALALQPQNVDLLYLLGHAYERMGKDEVAALEKASPGSARAEQLLGESYSASSEWPSAVLRFQNAVAAGAGTSGVHLELGELLLRQGKLKRAAEEFAKELKLFPENLRALVRRGEVRFIYGDLDGALQDWTSALETDEPRTEAILGIRETGFGDAAFEQLPEELRKTIEQFSSALQRRNTAAAHLALAFLAAQRGDISMAAEQAAEARSKVSPALETGPCNETEVRKLLSEERFSEAKTCAFRVLKSTSGLDFRMQVARALFETGDYQASLDVLSKLPPTVRGSPEASYWRARGYEKLATAAYLRLYRADADSYRVHQLMGDLAAARNDDAKAIEEYQAAITLKPTLPNLHYSLGHVFWKDLKVPEARADFEAELKINPRHPGALNEIGDTYLLEHLAEKAMPYLTEAVAMEPHNPDFHRDLGTAYSDLHDYEKAAKEFQLALPGDHDGVVHYKLARVYQAMGQKEKATQEFALSTALNEESHKKLETQTERLDQIDKWARE
jgi:tetratricopeptide (TPR) repeat protein